MGITVRVVGIFFNAVVDPELDAKGEVSVLNVLNAAKAAAKAGNAGTADDFQFETSCAPKQSMISFYANHAHDFPSPNGFVDGSNNPIKYHPGPYFLAENLNAHPAMQIWQYYVLDANRVPFKQGIKYLETPEAVVPKDGFLTWRLVSVLRGVNPRTFLAEGRQQG